MSQLLPYETIVKASEGDPEAVAAVLSHYAGYIRSCAKMDGQINTDMQEHMDAAVELYGFCPDVIDQGPEDATVGALADVLRQSTVWYFWWD